MIGFIPVAISIRMGAGGRSCRKHGISSPARDSRAVGCVRSVKRPGSPQRSSTITLASRRGFLSQRWWRRSNWRASVTSFEKRWLPSLIAGPSCGPAESTGSDMRWWCRAGSKRYRLASAPGRYASAYPGTRTVNPPQGWGKQAGHTCIDLAVTGRHVPEMTSVNSRFDCARSSSSFYRIAQGSAYRTLFPFTSQIRLSRCNTMSEAGLFGAQEEGSKTPRRRKRSLPDGSHRLQAHMPIFHGPDRQEPWVRECYRYIHGD